MASVTVSAKPARRVFFQGLNELRAVAALAVLVHHIDLAKSRNGSSTLHGTFLENFVFDLGKNGVYLFFVLSGFLITYLLLVERDREGEIDLGKFYVRRILRIWPLYYIIVGIGFFLIPWAVEMLPALRGSEATYNAVRALEGSWGQAFWLYLAFLPNLAAVLHPTVIGASQAWSVGVEEQFYLIWPILMRRCTDRRSVLVMLIGTIVIKSGVMWVLDPFTFGEFQVAKIFLRGFAIELMALGGLAAYGLYFHKDLAERLARDGRIQLVNTVVMAWILVSGGSSMLLGATFAVMILSNVSGGPVRLRSRLLDELGKLSYGIYMYHAAIMLLVFSALAVAFGGVDHIGYDIAVWIVVPLMTFGISHVSYHRIEKPILEIKRERFSPVRST
jgi:peptidoglycan/LPS O-acetylase OafA/YrhL